MAELDFDNPPADPLPQVRQWLEEAETYGLENPAAMILATVDPDGRPSVRTVLLKGLDDRGAVFYTNRRSRKGRALEGHAHAALLFYFDRPHRQICIEGSVTRIGDAESDAYFATRPRGAQIGAWASEQSQPIESRAALEAAVRAVVERYRSGDVPRPPHWGGYRVRLERIEFWQGRLDRLHDRVVYTRRQDGSWKIERLSP